MIDHAIASHVYIGLMSGTSMDGIDGVLADLAHPTEHIVRAHVHRAFDSGLRETLLALNRSGTDELHRSALAGNALAIAYAKVVQALLDSVGLPVAAIRAIGAHGQTVRHQPCLHDGTGYTIQLLNGALLAERTGIDVVCDFRSRDVAAGGQGAPLVPAFHHAMFAQPGTNLAVLNIGGIANLTLLHADGRTTGHDCGPGNVLMDLWCQAHTNHSYDEQGHWARSGQPHPGLLAILLAEPYLSQPPPKSTGRDLFHRLWLQTALDAAHLRWESCNPADVQATLAVYTAQTAANDLRRSMPEVSQLLICGGGAHNSYLLELLASELPGVRVASIDEAKSMDPQHVEATAFAWLAKSFMEKKSANCIDVTGAAGPRILGCLYPS